MPMAVLGIAVAVGGRRPRVSCVLLDGTRDAPIHVGAFDLTTASGDVIGQLDDLGKQLSSKVSGLNLAAVVIRLADFTPVANRAEGPRHRLLVEGALAFSCRSRISEVLVRTGREVGQALGVSKDVADSTGRTLDAKRADAAAAALSALPEGAP